MDIRNFLDVIFVVFGFRLCLVSISSTIFICFVSYGLYYVLCDLSVSYYYSNCESSSASLGYDVIYGCECEYGY